MILFSSEIFVVLLWLRHLLVTLLTAIVFNNADFNSTLPDQNKPDINEFV